MEKWLFKRRDRQENSHEEPPPLPPAHRIPVQFLWAARAPSLLPKKESANDLDLLKIDTKLPRESTIVDYRSP